MVTVDNFSYGINNIISTLEEQLAQVQVHLANNIQLTADECLMIRANIDVASMQLSALADDCNLIPFNEDNVKAEQNNILGFRIVDGSIKDVKYKEKGKH